MIDPTHSLAFSVQSNPGVYAVLIGSGVSRQAGISTGWEITHDLIRKLAASHGEDCGSDPESWYSKKYKKSPDYSEIIEQLAKTPSERQLLLKSYFEPNDDEREEGLKQPTDAHKAIAAIAAQKFIKVIITTNFDRLTENALKEAGAPGPIVLSSPDQVKGMRPLQHMEECCLIKLHGDYLDTPILNTERELENYSPEIDGLLDRIIDEYGLIVCGWSAKWDPALRKAIERAPSRRFTTYWAAYGDLNEETEKLIQHRNAEVIQIQGADEFFQNLHRQVEAIQNFSKVDPLSKAVAVASLKRYLSPPQDHIRVSELVNEVAHQVVEAVSTENFPLNMRPDVGEIDKQIPERLARYKSACETLLEMAVFSGAWAEEESHYVVWEQALTDLVPPPIEAPLYMPSLARLRNYPGTLLLYALGIGAVAKNRFGFLRRMFDVRFVRPSAPHADETTAVEKFSLLNVLDSGWNFWDDPEKERNLELPTNDWMRREMLPFAKQIIPNEKTYTWMFDKLEILMAANSKSTLWYAFLGRPENRKPIIEKLKTWSIAPDQQDLYVRRGYEYASSGILGDTASESHQNIVDLEQRIEQRILKIDYPWGDTYGWL
ncbi:MAG: SIR2 family protein [Candidatus Poribacteria bacterium]|nr:SIR2 family protein [Candidatus Poribacteria bacterium]